ncbi:MAG: N-acetylmuramoyl-L-alanine amidase [Candidatus Omnitrophota bacterium]
MLKKFFYVYILTAAALGLSSCARAPVRGPGVYPSGEVFPPQTAHVTRQNICHIVGPGETIWRISKMYDVDMRALMRKNNLKHPTDLKMGQQLMVPAAAPVRPVIPLYNTAQWKYIIVHHSATDEGNALSLFDLHLKRGFTSGLGYHFVIANGSCGKIDGQIEASPRWIKQMDGAHCKASGMNHQGIGICLVGNFSKELVPEKQLDALVYLVKVLKKQYKVPYENILGHGQVPDARTECPGTRFPWEEFHRRIRASE